MTIKIKFIALTLFLPMAFSAEKCNSDHYSNLLQATLTEILGHKNSFDIACNDNSHKIFYTNLEGHKSIISNQIYFNCSSMKIYDIRDLTKNFKRVVSMHPDRFKCEEIPRPQSDQPSSVESYQGPSINDLSSTKKCDVKTTFADFSNFEVRSENQERNDQMQVYSVCYPKNSPWLLKEVYSACKDGVWTHKACNLFMCKEDEEMESIVLEECKQTESIFIFYVASDIGLIIFIPIISALLYHACRRKSVRPSQEGFYLY